MALQAQDFMKALFQATANNPLKVLIPNQYLSGATTPYFVGDQNIPWANNSMDLATAQKYGAPETAVRKAPAEQITPGYQSTQYGWVPFQAGTPDEQSFLRNVKTTEAQKTTPVTPPSPSMPTAPMGMSDLQKRLLTMGQSLYDTAGKPFQYGTGVQDLLNRISQFNPQEFAQWANTPVQWTEQDIRNQYSGAFSDLARQREIATKQLLAELQSRGLGRAGIVETSLGDLASEYARQESNILTNVMADLLKSQEELSQSRRRMGLEGYGTAAELATRAGGLEREAAVETREGRQLSANILNLMSEAATAERGLDITATKTEIDKVLQSRELNIRDKLANLEGLMTNANITNDTKRVALESIRTETDRMNTEAQTALARANFELAEKSQADAIAYQKFMADLEERTREFERGATQQQLRQNLLNTLVNVYGLETEDATRIWELITSTIGQLAA